VTLPDTNTVTTSYNGALTTVTDQVGRQKRSEADGLGRTIKVTEMDNSKQLTWDTTYGYDLNDNLTSVNQGGQTRAFKYDSLSRMTYERTPEHDAPIAVTENNVTTNWSAHYTYTSFNAIATREDARRVISTYSYDGLNRLYQVGYTLPNPNPDNVQATATVNIAYGSSAPKNGQVEEVKQSFSPSDVPWKESYVYDGLSRPSSKTVSFDSQAQSYTTGYAYNQAGQITQMTYPSNKVVKYGFDNRGRLNTVGEGNVADKYVSSIGYQPSQQVSSISLKNGVTENYGYSTDRLQLTSHTATKAGNTLMSLTYNYVADRSRSGGVGSGQANTGQLMDISSATVKDPNNNTLQRNESYNYDQVSRLAQASGFYAQRNYTYDRWGNRTAVSGGSSTQSVALQQPGGGVTNNRIANLNNGPSYQYDAAGDVTYDAVHFFSYDAESRIVKVDSGSTGTYSYDSANRRVKRAAEGHTTYYVWEGSKVIAEYDDAPAGVGGTRFYHPDRLSNRMITDGSGAVKGTMDNLPFGEDGGVIGESEKHRFTSYQRDVETPSDYATNRQYSQVVGRFMRPDPVAGSIADPQSLNRYGYVQNDPVNFADPLGLLRICFFNMREVSVPESPWFPRGVATVVEFEGCFDLPDVGTIREPREPGRDKRKRQSLLNRDKCKKLLDEIYEIAKIVYDRYQDMWKDRLSLGVDPTQKVVGSLVGHNHQYDVQQQRLRDKLNDFDSNRCKNNTGYPKFLDAVWGKDVYITHRVIDTHMAALRKKLEDDPNNPKHILSVRGIGYKLGRNLSES
jgi:RHS repeat-associated protein